MIELNSERRAGRETRERMHLRKAPVGPTPAAARRGWGRGGQKPQMWPRCLAHSRGQGLQSGHSLLQGRNLLSSKREETGNPLEPVRSGCLQFSTKMTGVLIFPWGQNQGIPHALRNRKGAGILVVSPSPRQWGTTGIRPRPLHPVPSSHSTGFQSPRCEPNPTLWFPRMPEAQVCVCSHTPVPGGCQRRPPGYEDKDTRPLASEGHQMKCAYIPGTEPSTGERGLNK